MHLGWCTFSIVGILYWDTLISCIQLILWNTRIIFCKVSGLRTALLYFVIKLGFLAGVCVNTWATTLTHTWAYCRSSSWQNKKVVRCSTVTQNGNTKGQLNLSITQRRTRIFTRGQDRHDRRLGNCIPSHKSWNLLVAICGKTATDQLSNIMRLQQLDWYRLGTVTSQPGYKVSSTCWVYVCLIVYFVGVFKIYFIFHILSFTSLFHSFCPLTFVQKAIFLTPPLAQKYYIP